jgi:hypothetical protein
MTPKDFDLLSAYIDDQLSGTEKAALTARLAHDNELQTTLAELRLTVRAMRSLPQVRPPRSFTLTPAQAGLTAPGRRPFFPALRFAAAISAMALVMVIVGDVAVTTGMLPGAPAAGPEMSALTSAQADPEATPEDPAMAMAPAEALPAAQATGTAAAAEVEAFSATAESMAGAASAMTQADATPEPPGIAAQEPSSTDAERRVAEEMTPTPAAAGDTAPAAADKAATGDATQLYSDPVPDRLPPLRIAQIALAMLTVMLALGAWFTRRI